MKFKIKKIIFNQNLYHIKLLNNKFKKIIINLNNNRNNLILYYIKISKINMILWNMNFLNKR